MVEHWTHQLLIPSAPRSLLLQKRHLREVCRASFERFAARYGAWQGERVSVAQSCPTHCDPMDRGPPGSSVHGILQARALEWVSTPSSRGIIRTQGLNPCLLHLLHWQADTLMPPGKPWHVEGLQQMFTKGIQDRTRITRKNLSDKLLVRDIWAPGGPARK